MKSFSYKEEVFDFLGPLGAMIASSKSAYRERNPKNLAIFNANVCVLSEEHRGIIGSLGIKKTIAQKVWWGDFDLTENFQALKDFSAEICRPVVLLQEMDGRFENEVEPRWENFVYRVNPDGSHELGKSLRGIAEITQKGINIITVNNSDAGERTSDN